MQGLTILQTLPVLTLSMFLSKLKVKEYLEDYRREQNLAF